MHRALVAVDGLGHAFDHRVEQQFLRGLGIAVGQQLHRTLDIGKQHRDLLPLTLKGRPCGEDLVSKVLGHVTLGRGGPDIIRNRLQGMAASGAELRGGRRLASAFDAYTHERSRTLLAKLRLCGVLVAALQAQHGNPPRKHRPGCAVTLSEFRSCCSISCMCEEFGTGFGGQPSHELSDAAAKRIPETDHKLNSAFPGPIQSQRKPL